ncbi:hypothetical protein BD309DRAFT_1076179 [Dichomitus squalens]|uniref:Uncharacterized protein n=1 Tax=Dichomitus squalens TaxID=114155 RepID=A0A4Q9MWV7_9APHY|nr:hypothetical protein BD311DRAFT_686588 [Dichomitus squalens]TBU49810.1 hypothetical protein BD309DRAFT_1076179 [Dichomitus squalens]
MVNQSKSPYNLPPANRDVDNMTYNPQADARSDNAAFDDNTNPDMQPVGARGADNQPTNRDYRKEDQETTRSDETGRIPRSEVDDLLSSATSEEKNASGTRGKRVDAFRQEREVDRMFEESGISNADQDVEIGAASGY